MRVYVSVLQSDYQLLDLISDKDFFLLVDFIDLDIWIALRGSNVDFILHWQSYTIQFVIGLN